MKEPMMIFNTTQSIVTPDPDLPKEFDWIKSPALRKVVGKHLSEGFSVDIRRGLEHPLIFWPYRAWVWAYFGKGNKGTLVMGPLPGHTAHPNGHAAAQPSTPITESEINALFGAILGLVTRLMATGHPIQDLHLPGGGNIPIPRWFLNAMSALGINVHVDGEQISRAEPRHFNPEG